MAPTSDEILAAEYLRFTAIAAGVKFDPNQPRDRFGRWARVPGGDFPLPAPQAGFIQDAADAPDRMTLRPGLAKLRGKAKVEQFLRDGLSEKFGHDVQVDLGRKMHLQTMKEVAEGLLRGAEDWPKARLHRISAAPRLPGPSPDAWAVTTENANGVEIMFNERQFGNRSRFLSKLRRTVERGAARPSQDNAAYVAVHEFGHVVDRFSVPKDRQILPAVWAHMDDVGIDPDDDATVNKYIRDQLGDYALHSPAEMIAEAFADVQLNGFFDAAPLSRVIVTRLRKYHDDMPGSSQAVGVGRAPAPVVDAPGPPGVPAAPAAPEIPKEIPRHRWGAFHGDLTGLEDIANAVENGKLLKDKSLAGGICGDTRLREYADGVKVVYKRDTGYVGSGPKHAADAEQLASKLALAMGIRAPRIYRNSEDVVHMEYMGDAKVAVEARRKMRLRPIVESPKGRLVGLLDLMLQNADRHEKNWMVGPDKEPVVIDHGLSWTVPDMDAATAARHVASPFAGPFTSAADSWGGRRELASSNDLTKAEVAELRRRIEALRPEFDRLGRGNWLDFSLSMLDAIGAGARGKVPQLGLDT